MRLKKSLLNLSINILSYTVSFLPIFIVRKTFLNILGSELLGVTSLYANIIGYLSIVEMGIGSAIIFSLYKPYAEGDKKKIKGYLNYYKKFYRITGVIILLGGIAILPFIHFFIKDNIRIEVIRGGFILFLLNTFITYMFTYKHCILNVAQEGYKISIGITISKFLISLGQVIMLERYESFYLYLFIQILVNIVFYLILNYYIDKKFSWLKEYEGNLEEEEKATLVKNIKSLFYHKIGGVFVLGTDNIVLASSLSLVSVAQYNNYLIIITAVSGLFGQAMNALTASIGNLLVEKDKEYSYEIHKTLFFVSFWIVSFMTISLFNTISHFIGLWIGKKYILDGFTVSLIVFNLYFSMMRGQIEQFKVAGGRFYDDRYAPIIEGGINLVSSIILVNLIGMPGVFLGTMISNLSVIFWTQPQIVYKYIFNKPLKLYFNMYFKYFVIGFIPLLATVYFTKNIKSILTIEAFILNCLINIIIINTFYLIIFRKNEKFIFIKEVLKEKIISGKVFGKF